MFDDSSDPANAAQTEASKERGGVNDGARTRDQEIHSLLLYLLSYDHHLDYFEEHTGAGTMPFNVVVTSNVFIKIVSKVGGHSTLLAGLSHGGPGFGLPYSLTGALAQFTV